MDGMRILKGGAGGGGVRGEWEMTCVDVTHTNNTYYTQVFYCWYSDLIQPSLMKAWIRYHFNGVGILKPKTEDDVQFLLNAETIDKALILNFLEL